MENNNHDYLLLKKLVKEWIKTNRNKLNYTQGELNHHSGMDTQTISKIENGRNMPELLTFINIAIALEFDVNEFIAEYKRNSDFFNRD